MAIVGDGQLTVSLHSQIVSSTMSSHHYTNILLIDSHEFDHILQCEIL